MQYLYNPRLIREKISELFSTKNEKWAIVGFVGYGALAQLPTGITKLSVVCWPRAGATHPDGVRRLLDVGVSVYFCENLHHKIYWAKNVGLIVGSANLSARALSDGSDQHEFCVYCDDPTFDIKTVLSKLRYVAVNEKNLHALDVAHVAAGIKDPDSDEGPSTPPSFLEAAREAMPKKWKIVWWTEKRDDNSHIREAIRDEFGQTSWVNDNDVDDGIFEKGDFVLQIHVEDKEYSNIKTANCKWLRVEFITKYKGQSVIVQREAMDGGAAPPFNIDSDFRKKFKEVFNSSTWEEIYDKKAVVRQGFIDSLQALYPKP